MPVDSAKGLEKDLSGKANLWIPLIKLAFPFSLRRLNLSMNSLTKYFRKCKRKIKVER
jgi:hypothetical protein